MKIVQINAVYGVGSTGRMVQDIHTALINSGNDSYVFWAAKCNKNEDEVNIFRIGNDIGHKVHAIQRRIDGRQGFHSLLATKKLCNKIKIINPDIIHLHNLHSNFIHLPYLITSLSKMEVSVLVTLHDCWFFTGGCMHFYGYSCNKWQETCTDCPMMGRKIRCITGMFEMKKQCFHSLSNLYINGVSNWTTSAASKSAILSGAKRYCTIYNWIDTEVFTPINCANRIRKKYGIPDEKKIILGVSQGWSDGKGLLEFLYISEKLSDRAVVILVGEPDSIPSNATIICAGFTDSKRELAELYSAADVFVNPSRMETFGLVTAEAMSCGTPVVAYDNTGSAEIVKPNCGILVKDGDMIALVNAVDMMLGKKSEYTEFCSRYTERCFRKENQVNKYLEYYGEITRKGK